MMKKYLVDTHVLLWWLEDSLCLLPNARECMENPNHLIYVSSVTVWELMIKKSFGKITIPDDLEEALSDSHFLSLYVDFHHALAVENLENHHRDPFDRMLLSQAKVENMPIITHDKIFTKYDGVDVILV